MSRRTPTVLGARRGWDDRGSESVEMAILLPVGILVLTLLVIGGRVALAGDRITGAAAIAAREASLARSSTAAQQVATSSATQALSDQKLHCTNVRVDVDTSGFATAPGSPAFVTVTVSCTVDLSDIGAAGLPGSRTLHDTASSPLDPARDRALGFSNSEWLLGANSSVGGAG